MISEEEYIMEAWFFSKKDLRLGNGDNRKIISGETHYVDGKPKVCKYGLHGCINILDAFSSSKKPYVWKVDITEEIDIGKYQICGKKRKYLWGFDATKTLIMFAKNLALINIEKIKPFISQENFHNMVEWLNNNDIYNPHINELAYSVMQDILDSFGPETHKRIIISHSPIYFMETAYNAACAVYYCSASHENIALCNNSIKGSVLSSMDFDNDSIPKLRSSKEWISASKMLCHIIEGAYKI